MMDRLKMIKGVVINRGTKKPLYIAWVGMTSIDYIYAVFGDGSFDKICNKEYEFIPDPEKVSIRGVSYDEDYIASLIQADNEAGQ